MSRFKFYLLKKIKKTLLWLEVAKKRLALNTLGTTPKAWFLLIDAKRISVIFLIF